VLILALAAPLPRASTDRRVFGAFAAGFVAVLGLWFVVPHTTPWREFAQWFRTLTLT
jgi:hypothetical protein